MANVKEELSVLCSLAEYLITREQLRQNLPAPLKVVEMEFNKADRIILNAINEATSVAVALHSTALRVNEHMQEQKQ